MGWEAQIVLEEVHEAQHGIEGLDLQGALAPAEPLPPSMDPLSIQDVVGGQEEPRGQELEEALILAMVMPQKNRRLCLGEVLEVLPKMVLREQVTLEGGPVARPGGHQVPHQSGCSTLSHGLVFGEELGSQPGGPIMVVTQEVQVGCG